MVDQCGAALRAEWRAELEEEQRRGAERAQARSALPFRTSRCPPFGRRARMRYCAAFGTRPRS